MDVQLGWAKLEKELSSAQKEAIEKGLAAYGLELMVDKRKILVELIKNEITQVLQSPGNMRLKLSAYLSKALRYNYTYLANSFSDEEGLTLEKYFITRRIERAKEPMVYEELSLNEITDELNFSSVSHFCQQFKKVTGITPAEFRKRCQTDEFVWKII